MLLKRAIRYYDEYIAHLFSIDGWSKELVEQERRNMETTETCEGYKLSDCCGEKIFDDIMICSECRDHCGSMCDSCELWSECENFKGFLD